MAMNMCLAVLAGSVILLLMLAITCLPRWVNRRGPQSLGSGLSREPPEVIHVGPTLSVLCVLRT
jgi:hypothetical protein